MIRGILGECDEMGVHPAYQRDIYYFSKERVAKAERTAEFTKALETATRRREAAKKGIEKRREALLERANGIVVTVPQVDLQELIRLACGSYNARNAGRTEFISGGPDSDLEFLDRICVNYLRHELSRYDHLLDDVSKAPGAAEAREIVRSKVYDAITDAYPDLASECWCQQTKRMDDEFDAVIARMR